MESRLGTEDAVTVLDIHGASITATDGGRRSVATLALTLTVQSFAFQM
jgi:hypothetical protein